MRRRQVWRQKRNGEIRGEWSVSWQKPFSPMSPPTRQSREALHYCSLNSTFTVVSTSTGSPFSWYGR